MPQVSLLSGSVFDARSGSSLLDAAANAGIFLPYSCKTGRCSSCKCKVIAGKTKELHPEVGLTEQEKMQGWILSCVRSAETDVTIEADDLGDVVLPTIKTFPCRISHIELMASDVLQVKLRLPPSQEFDFLPGQYVDVIGPNGIRRSYSLANANFSNKLLELHIRAVEDGVMSDYWFKQAKINDLLRLSGPLGTFFLRNTDNLDLIFIATGTGIAPVKAMLEILPERPIDQTPRSVTVLWGGRNPADLYIDISRIEGKFEYVPTLSRADKHWTGAHGYVQHKLLSMRNDFTQAAVYACGSDAMIQSAKELLVQKGLPIKRFYADAFVCSSSSNG
jgi:CDP-4-dehydro-6-deoxyglucose reductase